MTRIIFMVLPTLIIACGALEDLRSPTGPSRARRGSKAAAARGGEAAVGRAGDPL